MSKKVRRVKGGIIIIITFISIYFLILYPKTESPEGRKLKKNKIKPVLNINYAMLGGPFIVLGPNPGGIFVNNKYYWYKYYLTVENNCNDSMILDPSKFQLTVKNSMYSKYYPSNKGLKYQENRLESSSIESGKLVKGKLIFMVEGRGNNVQAGQKLIYRGSMPCKPKYTQG